MTSLFVFAVQRLEFSLVGCSFRIPSLVKPIYYYVYPIHKCHNTEWLYSLLYKKPSKNKGILTFCLFEKIAMTIMNVKQLPISAIYI